jgi:hypothetical protein
MCTCRYTHIGRYTVSTHFILRANTYPHREELRRLGGRWDPDAKVWRMPEKARSAVLALGLHPMPDSPAKGRQTAPARQRVHPDALTSRGNRGFGPDDVAYDDI